jgi:hypothetical protein
MMTAILALSLLGNAPASQYRTLSAEIAEHNLPFPSDAADLRREITSYSSGDWDDSYLVAYYTVEPDGRLHDLVVRRFDKRMRIWTSATFDAIGSVLRVDHGGGVYYLTGHSSPDASPLLVLSARLQRKRELDGFSDIVLLDGRLIFERSMRHFQPAHAAVLAIYDPHSDAEHSFYPARGFRNDSGLENVPGSDTDLRDRDIGPVTLSDDGKTFTFEVVKGTISIKTEAGGRNEHAEPAAPATRYLATCRTAPAVPTCAERPISTRPR